MIVYGNCQQFIKYFFMHKCNYLYIKIRSACVQICQSDRVVLRPTRNNQCYVGCQIKPHNQEKDKINMLCAKLSICGSHAAKLEHNRPIRVKERSKVTFFSFLLRNSTHGYNCNKTHTA